MARCTCSVQNLTRDDGSESSVRVCVIWRKPLQQGEAMHTLTLMLRLLVAPASTQTLLLQRAGFSLPSGMAQPNGGGWCLRCLCWLLLWVAFRASMLCVLRAGLLCLAWRLPSGFWLVVVTVRSWWSATLPCVHGSPTVKPGQSVSQDREQLASTKRKLNRKLSFLASYVGKWGRTSVPAGVQTTCRSSQVLR